MKIICSTILVVFFSSFVCCGFEGFWTDEDSSITIDEDPSLTITKEDVKNITDSPTDPSLEEEIFNDEEDEGSWVKDAGLGFGKAALGLGCAYIAVAASLLNAGNVNYIRYQNWLLWDLRDCSFILDQYGATKFLFKDKENSYEMDFWLNSVLARFCLIGTCTYGAYKWIGSAYNSFGKILKKRTNSVY